MKRVIVIFAVLCLVLFSFASCGDGDGKDTTAAATTDSGYDSPVTPSVTEPSETVTAEKLLSLYMYGSWTSVEDSSVSAELSEGLLAETADGETVTLKYTLKSVNFDNGNIVAVIEISGVEYTYTVYRSKAGYGEFAYMELITPKATIAYKK